jgi:hypothetical protein
MEQEQVQEQTPTTSGDRPSRWRQARPLAAAAAAAGVLIVIAAVWHAHEDSASSALPPGAAPVTVGPGAETRSFEASGVGLVELDGFNGKLAIGLGDSTRVTVTSSAGPANAPSPYFRMNAAAHTLVLACAVPPAAGSTPAPAACPAADYVVSVPAGMGVSLNELSGQANLVGLSGPVSITATSADTTAQNLRSPGFTAAVTSGTLDASFATAPAHVAVSVTSAHATLRLPGSVGYNLTRQAVSADIEVGVPVSPSSPYGVQAVATSGEISLVTTS